MGRKHTKQEKKHMKQVAIQHGWRPPIPHLKGRDHPLYGRTLSNEVKEKISRALKGRVSPMKNRKHTEESRKKMSKAQCGRKLSIETRRKMSETPKRQIGLYVMRKCKQCHKKLRVPLCLYPRKKFCSKECEGQWRSENTKRENNPKFNKEKRRCLICGKEFERCRSKIELGHDKFCSRKCNGVYHSGKYVQENHPNWQGGISALPYAPGWTKRLKKSIKSRDHHTCQMCGKMNCNLDIHHIDYDKGNHAEDNLISLCKKCHGLTMTRRQWWIDYFLEI